MLMVRLDNDVSLAHSVPLQARSQQMFCLQNTQRVVCAEGNGSGPRGRKQETAFGYWSVSGATKLRLKRSTEQRLCGPTRGAAKKMGVDHKVVNRLMYMADHDIVLIDWTRHRGPFAFKNSNSVTDSYLPYCLDLCNLQQTLSQTVSERKLNQAQQMLRLELGGCFTTAAVRQQL